MKNLKRALAVVISLAMVMTTVVFASSFTDVTSDAGYAQAINVGVALKLFTGYEDGTFKPDGDITRAEFAAIVVRAMGQEAQADGAKGTTKFIDVASSHWAAGYINIASQSGIVNGYGDGNFGPEDKVTYEQAVKMMVVALGYGPAVGSAGYPVGYLTIAQQNGMTTGVKGTNGVAINRGQVAQLVFNSLDVPLMEQTGFGTYVDYVVQDGSGDTYQKTLMSENLGVVKLKVFVDKSLDLDSSKKADLVSVTVKNTYNSKYGDSNYSEDFKVDTSDNIDVGQSNLKGLVGSMAVMYIAYDENSDNDPVALYAERYVSSSDTLTVNYDDIEGRDELAVSGDTLEVSYYETDTSAKATSFTVDKDASVYVNGYAATDSLVTVLQGFYGKATFSLEDTTSTNADYDTVFVTDYKTMVVTDVNLTSGRVIGEGTVTSIIFNPTNTENTSTLVDKDGKALDWSVLKENDVLSIQQAVKNSRTVTTAMLISDTVTGSVSETSQDGDENVFTIDGKDYKVSQEMFDNLDLADLKLEDEGTFYLDILGRIVNFDVSSVAGSQFGFVLATGTSGSIDETAQIKMFTYAGEIVTLDTTQKITLTKDFGSTAGYSKQSSIESSTLLSGGANELKANDFITFKVNSAGDISAISLANDVSSDNGKDFNKYVTAANGSYDFSDERFKIGAKNIYTTPSTIIMQAPTIGTDGKYNEDDYELMSLSAFTDDADIASAITAYNVDKAGNAGAILINGIVQLDSASNGVAMVVKLSTAKNTAGDTIDKATVLQNGNKNENKSIELLGTDSPIKALSDLAAGSVFAPKFNAKGEVTDYTLVASVNAADTAVVESLPAKSGKVEYIGGLVDSRKGARVTLESGADYSIPSTANVYVYAAKGNNATTKVYAPDIRYNAFTSVTTGSGSNQVTTLTDSDGDDLTSVYMLIRLYDDDIVDVVFYMF